MVLLFGIGMYLGTEEDHAGSIDLSPGNLTAGLAKQIEVLDVEFKADSSKLRVGTLRPGVLVVVPEELVGRLGPETSGGVAETILGANKCPMSSYYFPPALSVLDGEVPNLPGELAKELKGKPDRLRVMVQCSAGFFEGTEGQRQQWIVDTLGIEMPETHAERNKLALHPPEAW